MRVHVRSSLSALALSALVSATPACGDDAVSGPTETELKAVTAHYAALVSANYGDALSAAEALDEAIAAFVAAPSETTLTAAKTAWLAAREPYGQTEAFRFYGGPIDDADTGPEGDINAWPLDEAVIDYVEGQPNAGIINDATAFPTIDAALLRDKNEDGGTSEVSITLGFHAIEFLLWGQDLAEDGPGARPVADYVDAANADRRKAFLQIASDLLIEDLGTLVDAWAPNQTNYRASFVALSGREGLRRILTGAGVLSNGELAGERMDVALDTRDQEDEHSCFSDNTHRDIITNAQGIRNVLSGSYGTLTGPSVLALLDAHAPTLEGKLSAELDASISLATAIPVPFDRAIATDAGRTAVQATITALRTQSDTIVDAARALGISNLTVDLPEE